MNQELLLQHLEDSLRVDGIYVDVGGYDERYISLIGAFCKKNGKQFFVNGSFHGLKDIGPNDIDRTNSTIFRKGQYKLDFSDMHIKYPDINFIGSDTVEHVQQMPQEIAFLHINLYLYEPTKNCIAALFDKMAYGGTIYFSNFNPHSNFGQSRAIREFIDSKKHEIIVRRQRIINGRPELSLVVKSIPVAKSLQSPKHTGMLTRPLVVATVLKTGGIYNSQYVNNLAKAVKRHLSLPHIFVCLTDDPTGFSTDVDKVIKFKHNWPKWWGKIELFRPDLFENHQVLYFDLDTLIIKNIDEIATYDRDFIALRDFFQLHNIGSGVMSWNGNLHNHVYEKFTKNAEYIIKHYQYGDQQWIMENMRDYDFYQDMFPNRIFSYKKDCLKGIPANADIVCFHGEPRIHNVTDAVIKKIWNGY